MGIKWLEHQPISQLLLLTKAKQHFLLKFIPPEIHSYGVSNNACSTHGSIPEEKIYRKRSKICHYNLQKNGIYNLNLFRSSLGWMAY